MKCDKCGYSDNGTGDSAHTCFVHALKQQEFTPEQTDAPCPNCGVEHEDLCYHEGHGQYFCKSCWDRENKMTDSEQQEFKKSQREFNQRLIDMSNKRTMNELIERLAEQCYEHDQSWTGVGQRIFNKEKFAQLIVKTVMSEVIKGVPLAGIAKEDVFKLFGIDDYISLRCEDEE